MPSKDEFLRQFFETHKDYELAQTFTLTCGKHGKYTNNQLIQHHSDGTETILPLLGCPICRNEEAHESMMQEYYDSINSKKFKASCIPHKFSKCTLREFSTADKNSTFSEEKTSVRDKCIAFVRNEIRSIVLLGPTGLGKTHLLAAMLRGTITTGSEALYVVERKIYRDIHESYLGRKELLTEGQVIEKYSNIPVLGIDEIGRSSWTDHEAQTLHEIIDIRDTENRKTILAGNLNPLEFEKNYDESLRRKLGAEQIICKWGKWDNNY